MDILNLIGRQTGLIRDSDVVREAVLDVWRGFGGWISECGGVDCCLGKGMLRGGVAWGSDGHGQWL